MASPPIGQTREISELKILGRSGGFVLIMSYYDSRNLDKLENERFVNAKVKTVYRGHSSTCRSIIHFGDPYYKVVTSSEDFTIQVFNQKTGKRVTRITEHSNFVRQVLKWDDDTFLSCSKDSNIFSFSMVDLTVNKRFTMINEGVFQMLKLSADLFLCFSAGAIDNIHIISYSENRIVKIIRDQNVFWLSRACNSKIFKYCFYFNSRDIDNSIILMNYQSGELVRKMLCRNDKELGRRRRHIRSTRTKYAVQVFRNKRNEEVLVYTDTQNVYFYNMGISLEDFPEESQAGTVIVLPIDIRTNKYLYSSDILGERTLCVGDGYGFLYFIDLWEARLIDLPYKVFDKDIYQLSFVIEPDASVGMVCCCTDMESVFLSTTLTFSKHHGNEMSQLDLKERTEFLVDKLEEYWFHEEERKKALMEIDLSNRKLENILRIFVCLEYL